MTTLNSRSGPLLLFMVSLVRTSLCVRLPMYVLYGFSRRSSGFCNAVDGVHVIWLGSVSSVSLSDELSPNNSVAVVGRCEFLFQC